MGKNPIPLPHQTISLFLNRTTDHETKISLAYFVNIVKAASVIQDNYDIFRKAAGFDFHPLDVVLDMPNTASPFWSAIRKDRKNSSLLWGLLFGYGKENVCAYHWKYVDCPESHKEFIESFPHQLSNPAPEGQMLISSQNFQIPPFLSFLDDDDAIAKYEKEREKIRQIYQGKDHLDLTLDKLMR